MFNKYFKNPKPVVFGKLFNKKKKETKIKSLKRCYPKLLYAREKLYAAYADVTIDYADIQGLNTKEFITLIKQLL